MTKEKKRYLFTFGLMPLLAVVVALGSLLVGRYNLTVQDILHTITQRSEVSVQAETVLFNIRSPRIIAAFLVGGILSLTGSTYQGMFRNPMVSPSILGVSAGTGFGASLAILLSLNTFWTQTLSFLFGIGAVAAVYLISLAVGKRHDKCLTLILAGMVVGTIFTSLISVLKYVADPYDTLPSIVYWLMGGLSNIELSSLKYVGFTALLGAIILSLLGWKLDMLSFGDEEARSMGIHVNRIRMIVICIATLMTASAVSISGIIGWIGLLIPHISRMLIGPRNSLLLPASFFIGGTFLMIVDNFSRTIASMEIPLGITTSLIGAPFFVLILIKTSKK